MTDEDRSQSRFKSDGDISSELGQREIGYGDGDLTTRIDEDDIHIHREEIPVQKDAYVSEKTDSKGDGESSEVQSRSNRARDDMFGQEDANQKVTDINEIPDSTGNMGKILSMGGDSEEPYGHEQTKRDGNETFNQMPSQSSGDMSEIPVPEMKTDEASNEVPSQKNKETSDGTPSQSVGDFSETLTPATQVDDHSNVASGERVNQDGDLNEVANNRNGNIANCSDGDMTDTIDQSGGDLDEVANCEDREVNEITIDFSEDVAITSKGDMLLIPSKKGKEVSQAASQSSSEREAVFSITFHDLSYEVTQRKCCRRLPNKVILDSVSGEMKTGLNAIMGPTGSGKTTLLDLLADRKDKVGKSGKVLINGHKRQANFKTVVGYVVQDDVVLGTLSVRENLQFSAALRLPGHMTKAQRNKRVERVIETLGLYLCADTKVGTEFFRGVSGGERKRTNIGMELIIEPQVLFLDEPTTGLDAHTAVSVISLLKDLSVNDNRVIVLSIHQPRYSIFKLFDSLSLLSHGTIVYHGPANTALDYFERLGLACEEHENPANFFLDTIIHYEKEYRQRSQQTVIYTAANQGDGAVMSAEANNNDYINLLEIYRTSPEHQALRKTIDPVLQNLHEEKIKEHVAKRMVKKVIRRELYATSFLWQLLIVTMRSSRNILRSPQLSIYQIVFSSIIALILGLIYWQVDTQPNGFTDRVGIFFFIAVNQSFGSLGAIQLFIQQKALFIHENASGYYRVSAFFISKILTDLVPLRLVPNALFALIIYFMIGFQVEADKFFIFCLILMLVNICAVSVAFFISAAVRNSEIANLLILLPLIFSLLFAGLLISLDSLPVWVSWVQHISFIQYGVEAFCINEMSGLRFQGPCEVERVFDGVIEECNSTMPSLMTDNNCTSVCAFDGLAQLSQLGYGNTTENLWWDVFALILYSIIFLLLAYMALRLIKKEK